MRRGLAAAALVVLAATSAVAGPRSPTSARPLDPPGGERLFYARCGYCHDKGGTGTIMLARRLGDDRSLLANRTDLQPAYVKGVVRRGLNSMPALTRVEVTGAELDQIAAFLTRNPAKQGG